MLPDRPLKQQEKLEYLIGLRPAEPVGWQLAFGVHGFIWCGVAISMLLFGLYPSIWELRIGTGSFPAVSTAALATAVVAFIVSGVLLPPPRTPERAVRNFYKLVLRGNLSGAWKMLILPAQKSIAGPFSSLENFAAYWNDKRRVLGLRDRGLKLNAFRIHPSRSGIVLCEMDLVVEAKQVYIPLVGSMDFGESYTYTVRKLLVPQGREWFLWSGEFVADDEDYVDWLFQGPVS
jgi:hypothetical protein